MKFKRIKTQKSRKRLMRTFYFAYFTGPFSVILGWVVAYVNIELLQTIVALASILLRYIHMLSMVVLLILYIIHILIEGMEKPKVILSNRLV